MKTIEKTTRKGCILNVQIVKNCDECADTSDLGKYSDEPEIGAIVVDTGEFYKDIQRRVNLLERLEDLIDITEDDERRCHYWQAKRDRLAEKWEDLNRIPERGRTYRFFIAHAGGEPIGTPSWKKYAQQDFARMDALNRGVWEYIGITAQAMYTLPGSNIIQQLTSGGLWGIESDCDDYIIEVIRDELEALRNELTNAGFGKRAIDTAFANVEK